MNNLIERKQYIDVLRTIAMIGVIFIHVSAGNWYGYIGTADWFTFTIYEGVFRVSVPIFFMISGCLFLNCAKEKSIKELYLRSIPRLIVFVILWAGFYGVIQFPQNSGSFCENLKSMFWELLQGNTQAHLWFIYAIIGMYILVPFMKPVVQNSPKHILGYAILVCFVMGSVSELISQFDNMEIVTNNVNKIKSGFSIGYIGYFLLGAYIDKYNINKKYRKVFYLLGLVGMVITICLVMQDCLLAQTLNERFWAYTMPGVFLSSLAVFLFFKNINFKDLNCKENNKLYKVMDMFVKKSRGIYGIHVTFILIFWKVGFTTFSLPGVISVPIIVVFVLSLSFVSVAILQKIPFINRYIV